MAILDKNRLYDGWENLAAGMDAGRRPSLIDANQCAKADNVVFRGGSPQSRPGIRKVPLTFDNLIYYGPDGTQVPPHIILDGFLNDPINHDDLFSVSARFSSSDVGSELINDFITPGTKIATVVSASHVTLDAPYLFSVFGSQTHSNQTITIVARTNPNTFLGTATYANPSVSDVTITGNSLVSITGGFTAADLGSPLVFADPSPVSQQATIIAIISPSEVTISETIGSPVAGLTCSIMNRHYPGVASVTDADITGNVVTSGDADFTSADLGSEVVFTNTPPFSTPPPGTTITAINNPSSVQLSNSVSVPNAGPLTLFIMSRSLGDFSGAYVSSLAANFNTADVSRTITATGLSPGTFVSEFIQQNLVLMSSNMHVGNNISFTIAARIHDIFNSEEAFAGHRFQCASYYSSAAAHECLMVMFGGRLFQITPNLSIGARIREIPLDRRNQSTIPENFMVQADRYHITQDGSSQAIIFDGVSARRAHEDEVVFGTMMAYGIGRLVVVRGRQIYFGDLFGSHPGDPADSVLKFTETSFLAEGLPAEIPYTLGEITGICFYPSQDTATGQGELMVFTERGAVTFDLHLPRDKWKDSTFQQIALLNSTARGQRALIMVNGTLWIRSDEGWRDYRQARQQAAGWYQLPRSTEVDPWIAADTPALLRYASGISFDNRLIVTCNPVPNQGRLYHDGLLALDFDVLSTFGEASRPAWDGHWSGLKTFQLVSGTFKSKNRAFAFGLDDDGTNQLYEITLDDRDDFDGPISSSIEFRSHDFQAPFNEKLLYSADIWLEKISELVNMTLSFRPDAVTDYLAWKTFPVVRPLGICDEITCGMVPTIRLGFAPRLRAGKPSNDCEPQTSRLIARGYEFQPKLEWTGHCSIRRMRLSALQEEEDPKATC